MHSVSPEETQLIGLLPDDVTTVRYRGAEFDLGTVPADAWARLTAVQSQAYTDARRRGIRACAAVGVQPDALVSAESLEKLTGDRPAEEPEKDDRPSNLAVVMGMDPELRAAIYQHGLEVVAYSLRAHRGFCSRNREGLVVPIPFSRDGDKLDARTFAVYRQSGLSELVLTLAREARKLNDFEVHEKKASPP